MTQVTKNPSVDGWVGRDDLGGGRESWATIRSGSGNLNGAGDVDGYCIDINNYGSETNFKDNRRGIFMFDTSDIPSGATINSVTFSLYVVSHGSHHTGVIKLVICTVAPTSESAIENSDYNIAKWNFTRLATDVAISAITNGQYNDFVLNTAGKANINKGGITKIGIVTDCDADNSDPGNDTSYTTDMNVAYVENTDANKRPKLTIDYTSGDTQHAKMFQIFS
jgi:hypothetical protein